MCRRTSPRSPRPGRSGVVALIGLAALLGSLGSGCDRLPPGPVRVVFETSESEPDDPVDRGLAHLSAVRLRAVRGLEVITDTRGCDASGATHAVRIAVGSAARARTHAVTLRDCASARSETEVFVQSAGVAVDPTPAIVLWLAGRLGVVGGSQAGASDSPPLPVAALRDYLAAIGRMQARDAPSVAAARALLARAVALAPAFADAHAELAIAHLLASEYGLLPVDEAVEEGRHAIDAAESLAPGHGVAQAARGLSLMVEGRYRRAVPVLEEAHRRLPGHDGVLLWLGNAHLYSGDPRAARPWLMAARDLNPNLVATEISLGEAACYLDFEPDCRQFLAAPAPQPMRRFMVLLLRAHRGDYARVRAELGRDPPDVAPEWRAQLEAELCRALAEAECPGHEVSSAPAPGLDPGNFEIDLWRLDLGLPDGINAARRDPAWHRAVLGELDRLRANGVTLPVLDAARDCLVPDPVRPRALEPGAARLVGC